MIKLTKFSFNKRLWRCQKEKTRCEGRVKPKNLLNSNRYPLAEPCTLYRLSVRKRSLYAPEKRCFQRKLQKNESLQKNEKDILAGTCRKRHFSFHQC